MMWICIHFNMKTFRDKYEFKLFVNERFEFINEDALSLKRVINYDRAS